MPCPTMCAPEDMMCPGGVDPAGCPMPDLCMPMNDGECPSMCPVSCNAEEMLCPGPMDANGCMGPETCQPMMGNRKH